VALYHEVYFGLINDLYIVKPLDILQIKSVKASQFCKFQKLFLSLKYAHLFCCPIDELNPDNQFVYEKSHESDHVKMLNEL
jgi:hypothetical protein